MIPVTGTHAKLISLPLIHAFEFMDSQLPDNCYKGFLYMLLRIAFALLSPIFAFFSLSFLVGVLAVFMGELSISDPIFMPTQCKIVSSSVDIRSSKVCELGLLNYKAKHVFYDSKNNKFKCRHDYYWSSVFKVEYRDNSLGLMQFALTEAPNEALPLSCRPNFGAAWLTKDKFKVNETYDCWYISGIPTVKLYNDSFFSCQAKDPSLIEMMKRYLIISSKILQSWFSNEGNTRYFGQEIKAGVVTGFLTSIITICFVKLLKHMKSSLPQAINKVHIKRVCFLWVYFSVMGWLASHYWKSLSFHFIKAFNY